MSYPSFLADCWSIDAGVDLAADLRFPAQSPPALEEARIARTVAPTAERLTQERDFQLLDALYRYAADLMNRVATPHNRRGASPKDSSPLDRFADFYREQSERLIAGLNRLGYPDEVITEALRLSAARAAPDAALRESILYSYRKATCE